MVFLPDNGLAGGWGTVLCRDTACIMIKPLFAWLLLSASLCIVLIKKQSETWPELAVVTPPPNPPQPESSVSFHVPTSLLFVSVPEVFGNHFPLVSLSHSLSPAFWWWGVSSMVCFEWLAVSLAVISYVTVLQKSFVFPHAESVASRIKLGLWFQGVTPSRPPHPQTNSIMITHWYGRGCQTDGPQ